jgi:hypothetical protein
MSLKAMTILALIKFTSIRRIKYSQLVFYLLCFIF